MMNYDIIKKFPKSLHGKQCIGPCSKPNIWVVHPTTLEYITNTNFPFCPTEAYSKNNRIYVDDQCIRPSDEVDRTLIEMNMITTNIIFTSKKFLKIYYDIYSFENAVFWIIKNKHKAIYTKLRILNSAWKAYGDTIDVLNNQTINLYIDIIKQYWIKKIYRHIEKYIYTICKKIYFKKQSSKNNKKNTKIT